MRRMRHLFSASLQQQFLSEPIVNRAPGAPAFPAPRAFPVRDEPRGYRLLLAAALGYSGFSIHFPSMSP